jgi:ribokinase
MLIRQPRICVVGSSNIDLTFRTPRLPRIGETLSGRGFHLGYGGKGANQAIMAARLGARVTMVSRIGQDVFGDGSLRNYQEHGVDTSFVLRDSEVPSGVAGILVDDSAQNCIIVAAGANARLSPEDVRGAAAAIEAADALLCQLEVPLETTLEALSIAKSAGVRTILNPAPAQQLSSEILCLTDVCVPNETELEQLTLRQTSDLEQARVAGEQLRQTGPSTVIVTLGSNGALVIQEGHSEHLPGVSVTPIDPTGAGDAFIGSLAVFLAEGTPLLDAARKANSVAALTVTRIGTQTSFPNRSEISELPLVCSRSIP